MYSLFMSVVKYEFVVCIPWNFFRFLLLFLFNLWIHVASVNKTLQSLYMTIVCDVTEWTIHLMFTYFFC